MPRSKKVRIEEREVLLSELKLDPKFYPRVNGPDWVTIHRYKEALQTGARFPPLDAYYDLDETGAKVLTVFDGTTRALAAKRAKLDTFAVRIHHGLTAHEAMYLSGELNCKNGRPLSVQDRAMLAQRLKTEGYDIDAIARAVGAVTATIEKWLTGRIVEGENGEPDALKSATAHLGGSSRERAALRWGGPIANANVRRTCDEMLALLRIGAVDLADINIRERFVEIVERGSKLLKAAKLPQPG